MSLPPCGVSFLTSLHETSRDMAIRIIRKYANSVRVVICMVGLLAMQFHIPVRIRHCNRFIHYVQYWA